LELLKVLDLKNYDPSWFRISREAVRAVIIKRDKIALIKSKRDGFYKFPGGGIIEGESHFEALIRETREETGLYVIPETITPLGMVQEFRESIKGKKIFDQKSYYYCAEVETTVTSQNLDDYEKGYEFELEWTDIQTAHDDNTKFSEKHGLEFLVREAYILRCLLT